MARDRQIPSVPARGREDCACAWLQAFRVSSRWADKTSNWAFTRALPRLLPARAPRLHGAVAERYGLPSVSLSPLMRRPDPALVSKLLMGDDD